MMGLLCLTDGLGLGHVVQSYVKEATIAFTACRKLLPDPEFYAQCIEESFQELRAAAARAPEHRAERAAAKAAAAPKPKSKPASKPKTKTGSAKPAAGKPAKAAKATRPATKSKRVAKK
jgi:hypothetical protein